MRCKGHGLQSEVTAFLVFRELLQWCALVSHLTLYLFCAKAGKKTTDEELEEMLESGNPAIFTSGVSVRELGCTPLSREAAVGLRAVGKGRAAGAGGRGPLARARADSRPLCGPL